MVRAGAPADRDCADGGALGEAATPRFETGAPAAVRSVVTDRAIVLGNAPTSPTRDNVAITMVGQVPVRVRGAAEPGDLLVPSGDNDGTAIAFAPDAVPVECANQAFGEVVSIDPSSPHSVTAVVGGHARSAALIAIVQRLFARAGE